MSFGIRQVDCADAVINNLDTLLAVAVYSCMVAIPFWPTI